ncbi:unnamed protein product [Dibothriocephalus latus]|uniref:Uncharacterized protein n=1 Tax=Dibothriocephalus latus TaxID=60516 RepID=A0A3P7P2B7_DIBLA|nr:unnamed protein product [Dibothriocephalus latus]
MALYRIDLVKDATGKQTANPRSISLSYRQLRGDLILTFRIMNNLDSCFVSDYLFTQANTRTLRGHPLKPRPGKAGIDGRKFFSINSVVAAWNALPEENMRYGSLTDIYLYKKYWIQKEKNSFRVNAFDSTTLTVVYEVAVDNHRGFLRCRQLVGGLCGLLNRTSVKLPGLLQAPSRFDPIVPDELLLHHPRDAM